MPLLGRRMVKRKMMLVTPSTLESDEVLKGKRGLIYIFKKLFWLPGKRDCGAEVATGRSWLFVQERKE
jgi:hypothetical protein